MTRNDYKKARQLLRDNGRYALRWLPSDVVAVMDRVMFEKTRDPLADRAVVKAYDRRRAG